MIIDFPIEETVRIRYSVRNFIQRIDMGIAAAHFNLSAKEKGIRGRFDLAGKPALALPDHFEYAYSWLRM